MAEIRVSTNAAQVSAAVRTFFQDQFPFAASRAINRVMVEAQRAQREHQRTIFEQRRPRWQEMNVKIRREDFARKDKLEGIIRMEAPGQQRTDILGKFETEEWKVPFRSSAIFVPTEDVPRSGARIMRKWRPKNLRLRPHGVKSDRVKVGRHRTFMILDPSLKRGVLFERELGEDPMPLYFIVPRVDIEPELDFIVNVTRVVDQRFVPIFEETFFQAVRSAR